MLTFEQIKELIELVAERDLSGLELERSGFRLRIDGREPAAAAPVAVPEPVRSPPAVATLQPSAVAPQPSAAVAEGETASEESSLPEGAHVLNSPIVGTFYSAPSPDAASYVAVGDTVKKGQVLCIVEAMKLMNEIESDVDGKLIEIYPKNAQPVEFGEPLFAILPR